MQQVPDELVSVVETENLNCADRSFTQTYFLRKEQREDIERFSFCWPKKGMVALGTKCSKLGVGLSITLSILFIDLGWILLVLLYCP